MAFRRCEHPTSFTSVAFSTHTAFPTYSNTDSIHHCSISPLCASPTPLSSTCVFTPRLPLPRVSTPQSTQLGGQTLWKGASWPGRVGGARGWEWVSLAAPSSTTSTPEGPAVEAALCRAVLAPLKPALWTRLRRLRAPELRQLRRRQLALRAEAGRSGAQGAGRDGRGPAPALRSRIHARLAHLHAACAPRRKVSLLLAVCSDVYSGLAQGDNQGKEGRLCPPGYGVA